MLKSQSTIDFLKSKSDFWSWGKYHIENIDNGVELRAKHLSKKFEIEISGKLFSVRVFQQTFLHKKMTHYYQAVDPKHLHKLISSSRKVQ
jgi:hypothetical protein